MYPIAEKYVIRLDTEGLAFRYVDNVGDLTWNLPEAKFFDSPTAALQGLHNRGVRVGELRLVVAPTGKWRIVSASFNAPVLGAVIV